MGVVLCTGHFTMISSVAFEESPKPRSEGCRFSR
jgi:hypothetical protein